MRRALGGMAIGMISLLMLASTASADPLPGYELDAHQLEDKMQECLSMQMPRDGILMGWFNVRDGETRTWRCSSLIHMLFDDSNRTAHDPFVDVLSFMRCADRVVSYGFPRAGDLGNTQYIYQYNGVVDRATVVVNDSTDDVVTIFTRKPNDWVGCAA